MKERSGIALAGNLILDYYKEIDSYPSHSTLATILKVSRETGGLVCNCAQALSRIDPGLKLSVIGRIGDDDAGKYIQDQLGSLANVNLDRLILDHDTSFTDAMIDGKNKTRTFFQYRGANANLCEADFQLATLDAAILHVGYILLLDKLDEADSAYGTAMARLLHNAQAFGIKTSVDIVSEHSDRFRTIVPPALRYIDYAIINEYEGSKTTGIPVRDPEGHFQVDQAFKICSRLLEMGVTTWAVIHSREGAVGLTRTGERAAIPALDFPKSKIISTIGAGDAFLSGCLYGAYQKMTLAQAIKIGIAAATTSLAKFNATDGILDAARLIQYFEQTPRENWPGF